MGSGRMGSRAFPAASPGGKPSLCVTGSGTVEGCASFFGAGLMQDTPLPRAAVPA